MIALALLAILPACVTRGPGTEAACNIFSPIGSSTRDTVETRREIVRHNKIGQAVCGWTP